MDKTMDDKLMYISNDETQITPFLDYNQKLKCFESKLNESTNQNSTKVPKLFGQRFRKRYNKTLGTVLINGLMSPPSLDLNSKS